MTALRAGAGRMLTALLLAACAVLVAVPQARAASGDGLEVSPDGVSYGATLSGVFDRIELVIPGDSQSSEFWVRNAGPVPAYLRLVLAAVTVSDAALAEALTVTAGTTAYPGSAVPLSSAQPCRVLSEGELLPPGGTVRVSATLSLGSLDGRAAQGATAGFALRASLGDAAVGSLPPTSCGPTGTDLPAADDLPAAEDLPADGGGEKPLASTGSTLSTMPAGIGAGVLGAGLVLIAAARRRRKASR